MHENIVVTIISHACLILKIKATDLTHCTFKCFENLNMTLDIKQKAKETLHLSVPLLSMLICTTFDYIEEEEVFTDISPCPSSAVWTGCCVIRHQIIRRLASNWR